MKRASFAIFALLVASGHSPQSASAQDASIVIAAPNPSGASRDAWLQQDLADAQDRVRRSRNALIGTSAAFGLGLVFAGIGVSQCQVVNTINQNDELLCNNAGNVLLPLGGTFIGLGAIGMITSGIILGVANKRKREIQRDIRRNQYGERRLRWDFRSHAVVF